MPERLFETAKHERAFGSSTGPEHDRGPAGAVAAVRADAVERVFAPNA